MMMLIISFLFLLGDSGNNGYVGYWTQIAEAKGLSLNQDFGRAAQWDNGEDACEHCTKQFGDLKNENWHMFRQEGKACYSHLCDDNTGKHYCWTMGERGFKESSEYKFV